MYNFFPVPTHHFMRAARACRQPARHYWQLETNGRGRYLKSIICTGNPILLGGRCSKRSKLK